MVESIFDWPRLEWARGALELPLLSDDEAAVVRHLAGAGELDASAGAFVERLRCQGWLDQTLIVAGVPMVTVEPLGTSHTPIAQAASGGGAGRLSRFAFLRRDGDRLVLESSRSRFQIVVHEPDVVVLVAQLAAGLPTSLPDRLDAARDALIDLFHAAGMLADPDEDTAGLLLSWAPTDLQFHQRTRLGRPTDGYGATFPLRGRVEPPPTRRTAVGETIALDRPDLDLLMSTDPPLQQVLETRRSERDHDDAAPLTIGQLSELLFRTAHAGAGTQRPYPSAGGLYEIAIYPVVRLCDGLTQGVYRYDPVDHVLERVAAETAASKALLRSATGAMGAERTPQVVLVMAAAFGRVAWKYESIAYAVVLKNVGVLFAYLNIAASVMGLAGCAIGGGSAELFALAAGRDPYEEPSVGEFAIGSRAPT